ncbi:MAG TPA: hypothetical protein EYG02_10585 [Henriciella marina]|uniref:hypothetical protein n=1 Tax=Henriciella sp. TaxID=1968823 RepID=UPI00182078F9|nr:hypothetical protein [Henriciella sp.]HIG21156.1 hypothetical protein [Henriciella sp.]HIK65459.1 hypothetical protein [Henriciella marina]
MTQLTGFIEEGFSTVREAVVEVMDRLSVDFRPEVTQTLARHARKQIKFIEILLRRLILLLASEIELVPPAKATSTPPPREPQTTRTRAGTFKLLPKLGQAGTPFERLRALHTAPSRRNTASAPLLHRLSTLLHHLENPMPLARRMARIIDHLKAEGEPRPVILPLAGLHRAGPQLALLTSSLMLHGNDVLRDWFDTS